MRVMLRICSGLGNGCFLVQYKYVQMMHISKAHQINRATKKNLLLSIESWLFNRDPYFMIYEIIPTYRGSFSSSRTKQPFFSALEFHVPGLHPPSRAPSLHLPYHRLSYQRSGNRGAASTTRYILLPEASKVLGTSRGVEWVRGRAVWA